MKKIQANTQLLVNKIDSIMSQESSPEKLSELSASPSLNSTSLNVDDIGSFAPRVFNTAEKVKEH